MIRTVLFDLDGTLADTAPDLAAAVNAVRAEQGLDALHYDVIRPHVSHGSMALTRVGFNLEADHPEFEALRQRLLDYYQNNLAVATRLFPGMHELLDTLEQAGLRWGVVTNKPAYLTDPLVAALGLQQRAACIISGDTTTKRKPHPEPLLYACQLTQSSPRECVYIGDAQRDIEAGRRAGMHTLTALFGYIEEQETPQDWGADNHIQHPMAIWDWIKQRHTP